MKTEIIKLIDHTNVKLTTYISKPVVDRLKPAIVICPGGAYLNTSPREAECVALKFISYGYQSFVLDYSTMTSNPDHCYFPQPLFELAQTVKMIKEHSEEWYIDSEKIYLIGFSAGANLVANYGNLWSTQLFKDIDLKEKLKPKALILAYPLTDFLSLERKEITDNVNIEHVTGENQELKYANLMNKCYESVFGTETPDNDSMKKVSPLYNVNVETPPTFIWHTMEDELVPVEQGLRYAIELKKHHIPCELHVYEKGVHGLSLATLESASHDYQINQNVSTWFDLAIQWINHL